MSERDQLRDAIATEALSMHYIEQDGRCACGGTFIGFTKWRRHTADAVLAVLDQQGWVSPAEHEKWGRLANGRGRDLALMTAERDAALTKVAVFEAEIERLRTWSADLVAAEFAGRDVIRQQGLAGSDTCDLKPACGYIYRRVTESSEEISTRTVANEAPGGST